MNLERLVRNFNRKVRTRLRRLPNDLAVGAIAATILASSLTSCAKKSNPVKPDDPPVVVEPPTNPVYPGVTFTNDAVFLNNEAMASISSYNDNNGNLSFSKPLDYLKPGQVLILGNSSKFPKGDVRIISSVSENHKSVGTVQGKLNDAYENLDASWDITLKGHNSAGLSKTSPLDGLYLATGVNIVNNPNWNIGLSLEDVVLYDLDGNENTTNDQIIVNGSAGINNKAHLKINISGAKLKYFYFADEFSQNLSAEASFFPGFSATHEITVAKIPGPPIIIGGVPVNTTLIVKGGITGHASASITAGVEENSSFNMWLKYQNSSFSSDAEFNPPTFSPISSEIPGNAFGKVYLKPELELSVFNSVSANANVTGKFEAEASLTPQPWAELRAGIEAGVEGDISAFGLFSLYHYMKTFYDTTEVIKRIDFPSYIVSLVARPNEVFVGDPVVFDGSASKPLEDIIKYTVNFGDGHGDVETPSVHLDGIYDLRLTNNFDIAGTYISTAYFKFSDGQTLNAKDTVIVKEHGLEGKIAFASSRNRNLDIFTINPDGTGEINITNSSNSHENSPSWSPDGKKIVYDSWSGYNNSHIWVMNSDGTNKKQLTSDSRDEVNPVFSNDGSQIMYLSTDFSVSNPDAKIYLMNSDGTNTREVPWNFAYIPQEFSWSPDNNFIAFTSFDENRDRQIYLAGLYGLYFDKLTNKNDRNSHDPSWSPDSRTISFVSEGDEDLLSEQVYLMDRSGTNQREITHDRLRVNSSPSFSPEGEYLVYSSGVVVGGNYYTSASNRIWIMNKDGANQTQITFNTNGDYGPVWQPNKP